MLSWISPAIIFSFFLLSVEAAPWRDAEGHFPISSMRSRSSHTHQFDSSILHWLPQFRGSYLYLLLQCLGHLLKFKVRWRSASSACLRSVMSRP